MADNISTHVNKYHLILASSCLCQIQKKQEEPRELQADRWAIPALMTIEVIQATPTVLSGGKCVCSSWYIHSFSGLVLV